MPGLGRSPVSDPVAQTLHEATLTLLERTQEALTTAPRRIGVYGYATGSPVVIEGEKAYRLAGGGSLRVLSLEGQLEAPIWQHLRQFNILLDALPNVHLCINQVDPQDDGFCVRLAAQMLIRCPSLACCRHLVLLM